MEKSIPINVSSDPRAMPLLMITDSGGICIPIDINESENRKQEAIRLLESCAFHLLAYADQLRNSNGKDSKTV